MAKAVKVKGYKVKSYLRSIPKDSRTKKVSKIKLKYRLGYIVGRTLNPTQTENTIRDIFLSRQYNKIVPVKDIDYILKSPMWAKRYGKANFKKVFKQLIKEKYIIKKGKNYIWQG